MCSNSSGIIQADVELQIPIVLASSTKIFRDQGRSNSSGIFQPLINSKTIESGIDESSPRSRESLSMHSSTPGTSLMMHSSSPNSASRWRALLVEVDSWLYNFRFRRCFKLSTLSAKLTSHSARLLSCGDSVWAEDRQKYFACSAFCVLGSLWLRLTNNP